MGPSVPGEVDPAIRMCRARWNSSTLVRIEFTEASQPNASYARSAVLELNCKERKQVGREGG